MQNIKQLRGFLTLFSHKPLLQKSSAICCLHLVTQRKVSNFRRPQLDKKPQDDLLEQIMEDVNNKFQWSDIRKNLIQKYRYLNETNVDAVVLGACKKGEHLAVAKDYVEYLQTAGIQPNIATLGRLMRVYNLKYHDQGGLPLSLSTEEQQEILAIYKDLRRKHDILDATTCENLILGLVATEQWLDARELLNMMKITATPSLTAYTELTVKALAMNEAPLAWELLEETAELRKQPKCEAYLALFQYIARNFPREKFHQELGRMLKFLERHNLMVTQKVINAIVDLSQQGWPMTATVTQLSVLGECKECGNFMRNIAISDKEFEDLREAFLSRVVIGKDVFQKSTPKEVEKFMRYVDSTAPYDCVIDGLNVAYSMGSKQSPKNLTNLLCSVVQYFKRKNKSVLVLGRQHMNNWPKEGMNYVRRNAHVFLANNMSQDDPFLLYATLKSGPDTDFFSRDLMRTHAFQLGTQKAIFRRWQQQHQYALVTKTEMGKIIVKEPIRHLVCAHEINDVWHVPYVQEYQVQLADSFERPTKWLCLKFDKKS